MNIAKLILAILLLSLLGLSNKIHASEKDVIAVFSEAPVKPKSSDVPVVVKKPKSSEVPVTPLPSKPLPRYEIIVDDCPECRRKQLKR